MRLLSVPPGALVGFGLLEHLQHVGAFLRLDDAAHLAGIEQEGGDLEGAFAADAGHVVARG